MIDPVAATGFKMHAVVVGSNPGFLVSESRAMAVFT
jgi:hypothetical protein